MGKGAGRTSQSENRKLGFNSRSLPRPTDLPFIPFSSCFFIGANDPLTKLKISLSPWQAGAREKLNSSSWGEGRGDGGGEKRGGWHHTVLQALE